MSTRNYTIASISTVNQDNLIILEKFVKEHAIFKWAKFHSLILKLAGVRGGNILTSGNRNGDENSERNQGDLATVQYRL